MPHFHVSGIHTVISFLTIVAVFGSLHLLAISMPNNKLTQAWLGLGF